MAAPSAQQFFRKDRVYLSLAPKQAAPGLFLRDTALARRHAIYGMLYFFQLSLRTNSIEKSIGDLKKSGELLAHAVLRGYPLV